MPPPQMIVTIDRVYVAVTEDDNVGAFVETLQRRLAAHAAAQQLAAAGGGEAGSGVGGGGLTGVPTKSMADLTAAAGVGGGGIADDMPFELRVLEVALDSVREGSIGWEGGWGWGWGTREAKRPSALSALSNSRRGRPARCTKLLFSARAAPRRAARRCAPTWSAWWASWRRRRTRRWTRSPPRSPPPTWSGCGASRTAWCGSPRAWRR